MKWILTALLLVLGSSAFSQVNLVLNPSFEDTVFCPYEWDQIRAARHWQSVDSLDAIINAADYYHKCTVPNLPISLPKNSVFYQNPHSGNALVSIIAYYNSAPNIPGFGYRDYIQGKLRRRLTAGKLYCVSFYVNLTEISIAAIRDIGAYLDNGIIDTTTRPEYPQTHITPQVSNTGGVISDTANWMQIRGSFIAKGNESFITLGNFKDDAHTMKAAVPPNSYNQNYYYSVYLIDDVSVIESDLPAEAGPNRYIGRGDSTYIGRPNEVGLECTWTVLGSSSVIGTGAGLWVKPQHTTQYVVTQTLCGVTKKDTVWVGVWGVGVPNVAGAGQAYRVSPNPSNGNIQLIQAVQDERPVNVQVVEATGRLVREETARFSGGKAGLDLSALAPGCYFIQLKNQDGNMSSLRLLKQ